MPLTKEELAHLFADDPDVDGVYFLEKVATVFVRLRAPGRPGSVLRADAPPAPFLSYALVAAACR